MRVKQVAAMRSKRPRISGDDRGIRPARPPFSIVRYWGKIFMGLLLLVISVAGGAAFSSRLGTTHGTATDFVRVLAYVICGAIAVLGIQFIRWAFAEGDRAR